jgi:rsbT co-antagonist protein RsbR
MADEGDPRDELAQQRRRSRQRRDGSSLALIDADLDGRITAWNRRAEQVFGWSEAEIRGQSFAVLGPPSARAQVEAAVASVLRGERTSRRWHHQRKDGATITCEWNLVVLRDPEGAPESLSFEARDVTEEEAVQRRQQLMQALADHSPLGIFAKGPDGRHLYANAAFAASLGQTPAEVVGRDDFALFDREIAADLRRNDEEIAAGGEVMAREDAGVGPNAGRTYWTLKFPLRDASGATVAICGIINDISERKQAEQVQAELQARVIASQQALLAELSSPLIPLADGVLAMPLIGTIDAARAEHIVATLLAGVAELRARAVILDITGARAIDAGVADALLRAARAVRLLGAEAILTGVGPDVAQTLVALGVDMRGLVTLASLRSGIEYAQQRRR